MSISGIARISSSSSIPDLPMAIMQARTSRGCGIDAAQSDTVPFMRRSGKFWACLADSVPSCQVDPPRVSRSARKNLNTHDIGCAGHYSIRRSMRGPVPCATYTFLAAYDCVRDVDGCHDAIQFLSLLKGTRRWQGSAMLLSRQAQVPARSAQALLSPIWARVARPGLGFSKSLASDLPFVQHIFFAACKLRLWPSPSYSYIVCKSAAAASHRPAYKRQAQGTSGALTR
ncbi:hypothetical protein DENSPDRAFT_228474 [Dentipellis sp. KUC8613]|nr:hypothetical protein DENSPDRAFT_228474 [Dentipellis sp. KUC8613]